MSHAEHFLSRLVRLADDEIKLALALYYDAEWVQTILSSACVSESAERVALSLSDDAQRGSFVVVTRSGHFVTCLARDMNPGELPIVPRDRLTHWQRTSGGGQRKVSPYTGSAQNKRNNGPASGLAKLPNSSHGAGSVPRAATACMRAYASIDCIYAYRTYDDEYRQSSAR